MKDVTLSRRAVGADTDHLEDLDRQPPSKLLADHPDELRRLAKLYGWDMTAADTPARVERLVLRTMDLGAWDDVLLVEALIGHPDLRRLVLNASAGALSPRAWSFWHYRLGLVAAGEDVPPRPVRRTG